MHQVSGNLRRYAVGYGLQVYRLQGSDSIELNSGSPSEIRLSKWTCNLICFQPPSLATLALTESALLRYHSDEPVAITIGPFPQVERVNAQNRYGIHAL